MINCWEIGREEREKEPELAIRAENGELPLSFWKGGVDKTIMVGKKYGTLNYLAYWQGLRGEDLDLDLMQEPELICTKTGMKVIFTGDVDKHADT